MRLYLALFGAILLAFALFYPVLSDPLALPKNFSLVCPSSCIVGQSCSCFAMGCPNGFAILGNLEGSPIDNEKEFASGNLPITFFSDPVFTKSFATKEDGKVKFSVFCLEILFETVQAHPQSPCGGPAD